MDASDMRLREAQKIKKSSNDNVHHSYIISQNKTFQDITDRILIPTPSLFPSRPKTGCFELDTTNYQWNTESPFRRKALSVFQKRKHFWQFYIDAVIFWGLGNEFY